MENSTQNAEEQDTRDPFLKYWEISEIMFVEDQTTAALAHTIAKCLSIEGVDAEKVSWVAYKALANSILLDARRAARPPYKEDIKAGLYDPPPAPKHDEKTEETKKFRPWPRRVHRP